MKAPLLTLALLLLGAPSWAQSRDDVRRSLIARATEARDRGALEDALSLAREAEAIRGSASLSLAIAEIEQSMQRPLAALADARGCVRALEADPGARDRARLLSVCGALVSSVESRVAHLAFSVADDVAEVEVRVDGHALSPDARAHGVEVLAGSVVIDAVAPHQRPFHRELSVAPRASETVEIRFEADTPATTTRREVARDSQTPVEVTPPREVSHGSRGAGVGPWIVMGAGLAGVALSAVFFALREGAYADFEATCVVRVSEDRCGVTDANFASSQASLRAANTFTTATYVSLGVGGAALVGGLLWRVLGARAEAPVSVGVAPSEHGATTSLRLRF